jgi:hypothetical protein
MSRRSSLVLGLSVCGAAAALAASPARADDGVVVPVDPTAIVDVATAAVSSPLDAQAATAQQPPAVPETLVIPVVSPTILPTIPPVAGQVEAPSTPGPVATASPEQSPAPVVPPSTTAPSAPPSPPVHEADTAPRDTANTSSGNSNGITIDTSTITSQTFVWNWFWNCADNEGMPAVPAPPAGATTVVLNWHWACAAPPPPLEVAGVTVCTSCNIAISVRVGSPGDTGDVAQSIAATTAAAAANVADTIQAAFEAAIPPSAPQAGPATAVVLSSVTAGATTYRIDDGIVIAAPPSALPEDPPLHGAPTSYGGGSAAQPPDGNVLMRSRAQVALSVTTRAGSRTRIAVFQQWILRRSVVRAHVATASGIRTQASGLRGPAPPAPAPSAPTPFMFAAGTTAPHDGGVGVLTALAAGLALAFLYALLTALRLPPAVPPERATGANPHPPG